MKLGLVLVAMMVGAASFAQTAEFSDVRLSDDGSVLVISERGGTSFSAPKLDNQNSFEKPGISKDRRYVGWLALFPSSGASYAQPLSLVILDATKHTRQFRGDFGMVFRWCYVSDGTAVVYRYQFPHGVTPIGFDMRRLKDGKLLLRSSMEPVESDEDEAQVVEAKAPAWTKCAR